MNAPHFSIPRSRQSMTLSDSVREKAPEELYGVILAKDNRIYELSDQVSQLEATVVDLKVGASGSLLLRWCVMFPIYLIIVF